MHKMWSAYRKQPFLPLQCSPRPNFRKTKQKEIKFDEFLFYANSDTKYYSQLCLGIENTASFLYQNKNRDCTSYNSECHATWLRCLQLQRPENKVVDKCKHWLTRQVQLQKCFCHKVSGCFVPVVFSFRLYTFQIRNN